MLPPEVDDVAQIAKAMAAVPNAIAGYSCVLQEMEGKLEPDELWWRAERMLEIDPNDSEGTPSRSSPHCTRPRSRRVSSRKGAKALDCDWNYPEAVELLARL
jgi:hypothetical protein